MVLHVHLHPNLVINFVIHVYKGNLIDLMAQSFFLIFFQKTSGVQNVREKSFKLGFRKQSHSLKFQKVGRYAFTPYLEHWYR